MYIQEPHRGTGLGRQLLERSIEVMRSWPGVIKVTLRVMTDNQPALALYESAGFEIYGTDHKALVLDDQFEDDHLMVRWC